MMEESPSYARWTCARVQSHLRGHLLEVGCGAGHYTPRYAALPHVERVTAIDIDPLVIAKAKATAGSDTIEFRTQDVRRLQEKFDSVICANVLEHTENDQEFLSRLQACLKPGGTLVIIVPAHPWLYARADYEAGHYRRYTRASLRSLLQRAHLTIDRVSYFNAIGAMGWFIAFRILQRGRVAERQSRTLIRIFDRVCLPIGQFLERVIPPPFGLSLIALCRR